MSKEETMSAKRKRVNFTYLSFFALLASFAWFALLFFFFLRFPVLILLSPLLPFAGIVFGLLGIRYNLKTYPKYWIAPPIIGALLNLILLVSIATTLNFSLSDYGTCRKTAMSVKGYAVWKHQKTKIQESEVIFIHYATVIFSDGYNYLSCEAVGIGPLWATTGGGKTVVGCLNGFQNVGEGCREDYFGVNP